jgi:hypothetical protein
MVINLKKEEFLATDPDLRVKTINKMLETTPLNDIAKKLDIPYSTFLSEMTKGDYVYIKRDKKYFKFIRNENSLIEQTRNSDYSEELSFLKKHLDVLKKLVSSHENAQPMVLDKQVYDVKAKFVNKNIKVNASIYQQFTELCENKFRHLKIQDLIAQALLDFINKYSS